MNRQRVGWLWAAVVALAVPAVAQDQSTAPEVSSSGPVVTLEGTGAPLAAAGAVVSVTGQAAAVRAAGASVSITAAVVGDVQAAGAQVLIDANVGGKVRAAGASVQIRGHATGDIAAAGGAVLLNAQAQGHVGLGGAVVAVGPASDILGGLNVGAASINVAGHITGPVELDGAVVTFAAQADGPVTIRAASVTIAAGARIGGDLVVTSQEMPVIAEGAVISGATRVQPPRIWWWETLAPLGWGVILAAAMALGTILAGVVLALVSRPLFVSAVDQVRVRPWSNAVAGLATIVLVPLVAAVLAATVVGMSAALAVLMVLPALVVFGHAVAAAGIAAGIFVRAGHPIGVWAGLVLLVIGAVIIALVALVPFAGGLLVLLALLLGTGALTRAIGVRLRLRERPMPPAT